MIKLFLQEAKEIVETLLFFVAMALFVSGMAIIVVIFINLLPFLGSLFPYEN